VKERLKSPRLRLFVALDLPDSVLDELVDWQAETFGEWSNLRLLPRASLHVTLAFLGYQATRDIERIRAVAFDGTAGPFDLRPREVVEVPRRRPRLYAVGLDEPAEALGRWQADLSRRLHDAGLYEPEKRAFWPHVTVARVKADRRRAGGRRPATSPASPETPPELPKPLKQAFQARRLTLYKSTLKPQGAVYEPLARLDLRRD
jgi:RNA 2',3'-cyclic 3'-phosphodiesterase